MLTYVVKKKWVMVTDRVWRQRSRIKLRIIVHVTADFSLFKAPARSHLSVNLIVACTYFFESVMMPKEWLYIVR